MLVTYAAPVPFTPQCLATPEEHDGETAMGYDEAEPDGALEIEVGPLRQPVSQPAPADVKPAAGRPLLAPMRTRREHLRRGVVVTAGLLVVLVALVLSITPTREALFGGMLGPTPTATERISAGEDSVYITLNPNWGAISLDKHPVTRLPVEGVDQPLRLSRGRHTIHWRFPPILDYTCHLTVPSAPTDNCLTRIGIQPGKKGIASVVMLQLSLLMLAPAYRHSLLVAMQAAFDAQQSSDIVRPGEVYRSDDAASGFPVMVAHQPLRATLRFASDAEDHILTCPAIDSGPGEGCMMVGDCLELCAAPWQTPIPPPGAAYQAYIVAHPTWRYTTLDGRVVADNAPDFDVRQAQTAIWYELFDERPMPITIAWDGANWHVSTHISGEIQPTDLPNPACATMQDEIAVEEVSPPELPDGSQYTWEYIPGDPASQGCLAVVVPENVAGTPTGDLSNVVTSGFVLLHRFGVMLAANTATHRYWPFLPLADAYEQAIAQKLARRLPAVVGAP